MNKISNKKYVEQVNLLLQLLPIVAEEKCFAMKGGTAINLFFREMPRLSVDIDLTYVYLKPRNEALVEIEQTLLNIKQKISSQFKNIPIEEKRIANENRLRIPPDPITDSGNIRSVIPILSDHSGQKK